MSSELEIVKAIAPIAAPFTAAVVETWVTPKLKRLHSFLKTDKTLFENAVSTKFAEYLLRSYEKNSYFNVLVFQNQQKRLEDIYIPLTVQSQGDTPIVIDGYRDEFLPCFQRVLITDTAGMGKSTIMKYLFLSCINNNVAIPIFIELRKLKGDESIIDYLYGELNAIDEEFDSNFILKLIKEGNFVFFMDGYDEIPLSQRDRVARNLQDFISKAGKNLFIMTSRPEVSLASFPNFMEFNIRPLQLPEAFGLLKKYDNGGELSTEIIRKLEKNTLDDIREFLTNPLLVSLLYKSYEYKRIIPFKKHIFYRQVFDALFESHDLTKGGAYVREKHSQLDIEDFHRVLRALGFITLKLGQIEFDKDTLLSLLTQAKQHCPGLKFREASFLKDLLTTVPLFNRDGDYYKWAHKSIQDYFAAQFIWLDTKGKQGEILRRMIRSPDNEKYYNVLDLYYDMDYKTFRQTVIHEYLSEFIAHYDCPFEADESERVSNKDISERKLLTFGEIFVVMPESAIGQIMMGDDFREMVVRVKKLLARKGIKTTGYTPHTFYSEGAASLVDHNFLLTKLLSSKQEGMFLSRDKLGRLGCRQQPPKRAPYKIILLIDSSHSSSKSKVEFRALNSYIDRLRRNDLLLDPGESRLMHREIQREIDREASTDLFGSL